MSVLEPPDEGDDLFAAFESQFTDTDEIVSDSIDFTKLTDIEIVEMSSDVRQELIDSGQMYNPTTERGRQLHSQRTALLVESAKRKLR